MSKNEMIRMEVLVKGCRNLNCEIEDIVEIDRKKGDSYGK